MITTAPQADRLESVAHAVEAVRDGFVTAEEIGLQIGGMTPRQGHYYAEAAAWLGLLCQVEAEGRLLFWALTPGGVVFTSLDVAGRAAMLRAHVARRLGVVGWADGLAPETVARRAQTRRAWQEWLALPETAQIEVLEGRYARDRIGGSHAPTHRVCGTCGMQMAYAVEACEWC